MLSAKRRLGAVVRPVVVDYLELDSNPEAKGSGRSMAYRFCVAQPIRRQRPRGIGLVGHRP